MPSQIVHADALRSVSFGSITNSYTALGTAFAHPVRIIRIINNTNADMFFSFDGSTDNLFLPANSFVLYDVTTNREDNVVYFVFAVGTQIFIKYSSAPSSGTVYVECLYGQGE